MPIDWTPERLELLKKDRASGKRIVTIAEEMGVSEATIRHRAKALGLVKKRPDRRTIVWNDVETALLQRLRENGLSISAIAIEMSITKTRVVHRIQDISHQAAERRAFFEVKKQEVYHGRITLPRVEAMERVPPWFEANQQSAGAA